MLIWIIQIFIKKLNKSSRTYKKLGYTIEVLKIMQTLAENIIVKDITTRTLGDESVEQRMNAVTRRFNPTKYNVLGFVNRSSQVVLQPRFYNVRDEKGRWAKIRQSR